MTRLLFVLSVVVALLGFALGSAQADTTLPVRVRHRPTPTATQTASPTGTVTETPSPTVTATTTAMPTPSPSATPSPTLTPTATATPSPTATTCPLPLGTLTPPDGDVATIYSLSNPASSTASVTQSFYGVAWSCGTTPNVTPLATIQSTVLAQSSVVIDAADLTQVPDGFDGTLLVQSNVALTPEIVGYDLIATWTPTQVSTPTP